MVLFQWHYLTVKCYITLEFPAWAQGRPGPGCFFAFITAKPSPLTHAGSPTCPLLKKKGKNVSHARAVIFFFFFDEPRRQDDMATSRLPPATLTLKQVPAVLAGLLGQLFWV